MGDEGMPGLKTLLILDDEESIRQSIAAFLEDDGYLVYQAGSGEEALEIVKTRRVDGAIVDIRLPGMDGNAFMLEARKLAADLKFVIHTGSADYNPPVSVKSLGITSDKVLIKPVPNLNMLLKALEQ